MGNRLGSWWFVALAVLYPMQCVAAETQTGIPQVLIEWRFDARGICSGGCRTGIWRMWRCATARSAPSDGLGSDLARTRVRDRSSANAMGRNPDAGFAGRTRRIVLDRDARRTRLADSARKRPFRSARKWRCRRATKSRDYRILPFWHTAGKIVRLRFDPPSVEHFEIARSESWKHRRQRRRPPPGIFAKVTTVGAAWQSTEQPVADAVGCGSRPAVRESWLISPPLEIPADDLVSWRSGWLSKRASGDACSASTPHRRATTRWNSRSGPTARCTPTIWTWHPLHGGRTRSCCWAIEPSDLAGTEVQIESIVLSAEPTGPPQLGIEFFGSTSGVQRAGRPFEVTALLKNHGGRSAKNVTLTLDVPEGVDVLSDSRRGCEKSFAARCRACLGRFPNRSTGRCVRRNRGRFG
jgi:hypothetical protein